MDPAFTLLDLDTSQSPAGQRVLQPLVGFYIESMQMLESGYGLNAMTMMIFVSELPCS